MRVICALGLMALFAVMPVVHAQPVKAEKQQFSCESLCAELFASIRADPEKMVMRLEEALIINESCAAEIVTAAIDAVNAQPALVDKIVATAMDIVPQKASVVTAAVRTYAPTEVASAIPVGSPGAGAAVDPNAAAAANVEIRRAELPEIQRPKPAAGEEVRRAELPLEKRSMPIVEVRRAEPPAAAIPIQEPVTVQAAQPDMRLLNVPKAQPMKAGKRR